MPAACWPNIVASPWRRRSRSRSALVLMWPSSAPSTACCCGPCPIRTSSAWCGSMSALRLLLVESLLLAGLGAGGGLLLGQIGRDALLAAIPVKPPAWMNFEIDVSVGLFAAALAVGTAWIFGLV